MKLAVLLAFFLFPSAFFGVPAFWWGELPRSVSIFEGAKIAYFEALTLLLVLWKGRAVVEACRWPIKDKTMLACLTALAFLGISAFAIGGDPTAEILLGQTYSASVFATIFAFAFAVSTLNEEERRSVSVSAVLGFVVVNLPYAIVQSFFSDPVATKLLFPDWGEGRAYGTFGNPNSLAFFAVLCLPLARSVFSKWRLSIAFASLLMIILLSRSLSAGIAAVVYFAFAYAVPFFKKRGHCYVFEIFLGVLLASPIFLPYVMPEKVLSLKTRTVIAVDSIAAVFSDVETFAFGKGSGAVREVFDAPRSAWISNYVDPKIPIDRAHNFFIDLALAFGLPFSILIAFLILHLARSRPNDANRKSFVAVFLVLSLLHTPGVSHLALLAFVLSGRISSKTKAGVVRLSHGGRS